MSKYQHLLLCLAALALGTVAFGQEPSLGDVARQQRKKQAAKPANAATKIVTNEDMPARADSENDSKNDVAQEKSQSSREAPVADSQPGKSHSAEEWKTQILAQKLAVAAKQQEVEQFRASIHFVEGNRYYNGVQYNEQQRRRQIQLEQMEKQLEQQKQHLADMQEAARRAGFGNSVSDPTE